MYTRLLPWLAAIAWTLLPLSSQAQAPRAKAAQAHVLGVTGDVRQQLPREEATSAIRADQTLSAGTRIIVAPGGFVSLRLPDGSVVRLYPQSRVLLESLSPGRDARSQAQPTVLHLDRGSLDAEVTRKHLPGRRFEVKSDLAVAGVRGTSFSVTVSEDKRFVGHVREGIVAVQSLSSRDTVELRPGRGVSVDPNRGLGALFPLLPTVPDIPIAPLQVDESALLQISYSAVPGASGYQFQVARDEAMTQVLRNGFFESPRAMFRGLAGGKYFISVRAVDANGARGAEGIQALHVRPRALAPVLLLPENGRTGQGQRTDIQCGVIAGSTSYRIQIARDAAFKHKAVDAAAQDQCHVSGLSDLNGHFFWRAAAEFAGSGTPLGAWSQVVAVQLAAGLLEEIRPLEEALPTSAMDATLRYQVQVSANSSFDSILIDRLSPDTNLPLDMPNGKYFVRWKVVLPDQAEADFSDSQVVILQRRQP